jgi:hypothetical protein
VANTPVTVKVCSLVVDAGTDAAVMVGVNFTMLFGVAQTPEPVPDATYTCPEEAVEIPFGSCLCPSGIALC